MRGDLSERDKQKLSRIVKSADPNRPICHQIPLLKTLGWFYLGGSALGLAISAWSLWSYFAEFGSGFLTRPGFHYYLLCFSAALLILGVRSLLMGRRLASYGETPESETEAFEEWLDQLDQHG